MHVTGKLTTQPWLNLTPVFRLSKYYNIVKTNRNKVRSFASKVNYSIIWWNKHISLARQFILKIIKQKIQEYQQYNNNEEDPMHEKRPNNFIDECLKLSFKEQSFSEEELINESLTMLVGVSWSVLLQTMY